MHDKFIPSTQDDVDRLHSFRLLAHAEVQQTLEDLATKVVDETRSAATRGHLTHAGHHLLIHQAGEDVSRRSATALARYAHFAVADACLSLMSEPAALDRALNAHQKRIKDNSAVKEASVRLLLTPLGLREYFFTPGFLRQATAFGDARNSAAHASGLSVGASRWPTGQQELGRVMPVAQGLVRLDRYVPRLLMPSA